MKSQSINKLLWLIQQGILKEYDPQQFSINYTAQDISIILDLSLKEVENDIEYKILPTVIILGKVYIEHTDMLDYIYGKRWAQVDYYLSKLQLYKKTLLEMNFNIKLPDHLNYEDL